MCGPSMNMPLHGISLTINLASETLFQRFRRAHGWRSGQEAPFSAAPRALSLIHVRHQASRSTTYYSIRKLSFVHVGASGWDPG